MPGQVLLQQIENNGFLWPAKQCNFEHQKKEVEARNSLEGLMFYESTRTEFKEIRVLKSYVSINFYFINYNKN